MIRSLIVLLLFVSACSLHGFDPDDDTFDPLVRTVVADGSTRLGDPSPFIREGYGERGFTYVQFSKPEGGDPVVQVSFIKMPSADDPAKALGGAMFLPVDTAEKFASLLAKGASMEKPTEVWNTEWAGKWSLSYQEEKGVVLEQAMKGQVARFILSVPAAKKLAGAVEYFSKEAKKE